MHVDSVQIVIKVGSIAENVKKMTFKRISLELDPISSKQTSFCSNDMDALPMFSR